VVYGLNFLFSLPLNLRGKPFKNPVRVKKQQIKLTDQAKAEYPICGSTSTPIAIGVLLSFFVLNHIVTEKQGVLFVIFFIKSWLLGNVKYMQSKIDL